ncbi:MAG: glycoside hydrolase family 15 protein, partial [Solirubrobacteraceae bacterium]
MPLPIEDYAVIGDLHTAALVGRDGSIDWLCLPHFGSEACFAKLLGTDQNGYWRIAPDESKAAITAHRRCYRDRTLVLETELDTAHGSIRVTDCMPIREKNPQVVRMVTGLRGSVPLRMELAMRFGYGQTVPWVSKSGGLLTGTAGPDSLALWSSIPTRGEDMRTVGEAVVSEGQQLPFTLTWYRSHLPPPAPVDAGYAIATTDAWWQDWSGRCTYDGDYCDEVLRSLITLKALTYAPTGGIVAAPTTSLPEHIGGPRNWDYRYCWIRDATFTLYALLISGFREEAQAWREWLLRAVAGQPAQLQIMYGLAGERQLPEREIPWLAGYEGSRPVRIGNAAHSQFQLDIYGEIADAFHIARRYGIESNDESWRVEKALLDFLESAWRQADEGIWEVRGPRRHFTHSKVMAWVAADRAVK